MEWNPLEICNSSSFAFFKSSGVDLGEDWGDRPLQKIRWGDRGAIIPPPNI